MRRIHLYRTQARREPARDRSVQKDARVTKPIVPVKTGDVVQLKKVHPCGANEWEVVRVGMDIGLRCRGCDRKVMLVRSEFDRRFRGFIERSGDAE